MAGKHSRRETPLAQVTAKQPSKGTPSDAPLTEKQIRRISSLALQIAASQPSKGTPPAAALTEEQIRQLKIFTFHAKRLWDAIGDMCGVLHHLGEHLYATGDHMPVPDPGAEPYDRFGSDHGLSHLCRAAVTHLYTLYNDFDNANSQFGDFLRTVGQDPNDFTFSHLREEDLKDPPEQKGA